MCYPTWVEHAKKGLEDTDVKVCTVVGFPLGATTSAVKAFETKEAIQNGADEIDMVINVGALKTGNLALVESEYSRRRGSKWRQVSESHY